MGQTEKKALKHTKFYMCDKFYNEHKTGKSL